MDTGIEPKKACRLEVFVNAYFTVVDGIKKYNKGRTVSWVVDSEVYALTDLEKDIGPYFQWGGYQKANFWVIEGDVMKCRLSSDSQLLELVRSNEVLKLMMIVGRLDDMEEPVVHKQRVANVVLKEVPVVAEVMEQCVPNVAVVDMGPELRELPEFGETIAGPPKAEEEEKEHFMTVGCDPDGDDPAGANEEWRYFKNVDDDNVQPIKNVEVEVQNRKRSRPMPYFDTEAVPNDEAGLVDDFIAAHTTYDKENPVIKEGHTFVDKAEFMEIIRTYDIKNEFESKIEHSDTERYRARCADLECGWKIYAKKLHGCNTFKVIKLSRKTKTKPVESSNIVAEPSNFVVDPKVMSSPGVTTRRMSSLSPASPGVTTRRMASLSPASPGVTTRRMASISPGGINRRLIIE